MIMLDDFSMKRFVVLSGAGISAESGLKTFRDSDGLWEGHRVEDVATADAWRRNRGLVLQFYNERRRTLAEAKPHRAHLLLAEMQGRFDVRIVTQNVDDLHERAGSTEVIHLHGELTKARSSLNGKYVVDIGYSDIQLGDYCPRGSQLRPHIVWFGEDVPRMGEAIDLVRSAEIFLVIGTSLAVYPAAGLLNYVPRSAQIYVIDPKRPEGSLPENAIYMEETASAGTARLYKLLYEQHQET